MAGFKNQAQRPLRRPQTRTIDGCLRRADGSDNQYELSFSSEEPYVRWGTPEILDHSPGAVDLARLNEIGVLLFNHDTYSVIGKVVEASVENGRGVAIVEMDTDDFSAEIQQKMDSGTLKGVSVRYSVGSWEEVSAGSTSADGKYNGPCDIARKWEPLEISIVSVPADPTVGVGRSDNYQQEEDYQNMEPENSTPTTQAAEQQRSIPTAPPAAQETNHNVQSTAQSTSKEDIQRAERQRASDITAACREFGLDNKADEFIRSDKSVADVNAAILDHLRKNKGPLDVSVQSDEGDKFREAAAHGLLLRGSVPIANPVPGANDFRRMRLRDLMNYCARKEGIAEPELMDEEQLLRQFMTPSAAFPAILDTTVNKAYLTGYTLRPATFERWTAKGSLSDFKPTRSYRWGQAGELLLVPEGGEIKHDKLSSFLGPDRQLATYGRQFTLTREAIINDDYELVTGLPQRYAASARRTRNRQVYRVLSLNPVIYDGLNLFGGNHGNLVAPGTAPSRDSLKAMLRKMMLMKDDEGNLIYVSPRYILVPVGMAEDFEDILSQITINIEGGSVQSATNSLASKNLEIIEEAELNVGNDNGEIEWYLAADETSLSSIQVDYLNGIEVPTIRRMEHPGQLGFIWDVFLDWGVTVTDYRGLVKNEGFNA